MQTAFPQTRPIAMACLNPPAPFEPFAGGDANILRHKIVVEKEVFGVLDVQIDGTDTGTEVAIQTDAVLGDLISLHGDNGIVFSSRRIINSSSLVVFEN